MWNLEPSFRFEIDNFSEKKAFLTSEIFVSGGCEWYLYVYPKGNSLAGGHLSLYLHVGNRKALGAGWKRSANYYFVVLNQSGKELYRSSSLNSCLNLEELDKQAPFALRLQAGVSERPCLLASFRKKGFWRMTNSSLKSTSKFLKLWMEKEEYPRKNKTAIINGFQVFVSQVTSARKLFAEHADIAEDFKPKNQAVKTAYMYVLLNLINKLQKSPKSLSEAKLSKACSELSELMNVGFKLDWLNLKLDEVSLEKKKSDAEGSRAQQLEERVSLELMELGFKLDSLNTKLDEVSLERKKSDDADESRAQQLEERVKNLELMELGFKLNCLNSSLVEVSLERKISYDANESRIQQLEERIKDLGLKLEEFSLERKKTDDAGGSRVQQLEESVKNIELVVSYLKVELDKKKDKSSADGFLLVDEVA